MTEEMLFEISNVNGVREAKITLKPGVTILSGKNGAGKTKAIEAITRAAGGKTKLEASDGVEEGSVRGPGGTFSDRSTPAFEERFGAAR